MMSAIFGDRPRLRMTIWRSASTATKLPIEWASTETDATFGSFTIACNTASSASRE